MIKETLEPKIKLHKKFKESLDSCNYNKFTIVKKYGKNVTKDCYIDYLLLVVLIALWKCINGKIKSK